MLHRYTPSFTRLLPILALPAALLLAPGEADATVSISNGFFSGQTSTATGFLFEIHAAGTFHDNGQSVPSAIDLDCELDESVEILDCVGELSVANTVTDIAAGYENGQVYWSVALTADAIMQAHVDWGEHIVPEVFPAPEGYGNWSGLPSKWIDLANDIKILYWHDGFGRREWYYSATWKETVEAAGGIWSGEIWEE
ncbi:hypothetical protein G6O69_36425 [Pseudenhygromyxa sp. WMMC2535]|uniref:hypothetical protein n=1 Tax=Pseudenhygromyxa sp. WMMC2535 TaxID=2712867 RepID=UPI001557A94C|nr:hypothetical protein [Pseudenhygromyxa sp. WMMC2535]NVB43369.1 hypothetical protein [Pseudenhygromyxa sp. WMMC2535]